MKEGSKFNEKSSQQEQTSLENIPGFLPEKQTAAEKEQVEKIKTFAKQYDVPESAVSLSPDGNFLVYGQPLPMHLRENYNEEDSQDLNKIYSDTKEWKRDHPHD